MNIAEFIKALAGFSWMAVIGLGILAIARASRKQSAKGITSAVLGLIVLAVVLTVAGAGLVFIEPTHAGVVITILGEGGMRPEPLLPGLHWIVPFVERVELYPTTTQTFTMARTASEGETQGLITVEARTSDGQRIFVDSSVIYRIEPSAVPQIHRTWQRRYQDDLILPQTRGIIRDAVSQYRVEEVVSTKRFDMTNQITTQLQQVMAENGLTLVDFVLRDITFTEEYAQSIEQKQIAEQLALQAKFVVEQKKQEAEQARQVAQGQADAAVIAAKGAAEAQIIQAEAQAKANELIGQSLQANPEILQYQYILKLAPSVQTIFIPSGNQFILPLPNTTINPGVEAP
ncbi:MAG: prohibitin family protein [Chloroflexota bacterium]|nr:prohibitin family protein [Chloroflexota bacterium]MBI5704328.1 prohibitin family protein [Chloroflexota bacterium]